MTRCWRACGREGRGYGLTAANSVRPAALCAAAALWAQAPELAESLWLRRVSWRPIWVGHSPRLGSLLSRVYVPVSVHTHTLSHWLKPMASTLTDLGARAGAGCGVCAAWVVGVLGGASAPPIRTPTSTSTLKPLKRLNHRRASQDRATSSVEQPCHEAAQAPAAQTQTSMSARAQSASACANRSTRLACPPPQHPTCRGVRTGTLYACGMRAVR